jgi:hypothetical protein
MSNVRSMRNKGFHLMQEHKWTQMQATKNDPCSNQQLIDQFFWNCHVQSGRNGSLLQAKKIDQFTYHVHITKHRICIWFRPDIAKLRAYLQTLDPWESKSSTAGINPKPGLRTDSMTADKPLLPRSLDISKGNHDWSTTQINRVYSR